MFCTQAPRRPCENNSHVVAPRFSALSIWLYLWSPLELVFEFIVNVKIEIKITGSSKTLNSGEFEERDFISLPACITQSSKFSFND